MGVYYIKQKVSMEDKYIIYNSKEEKIFEVLGETSKVIFDRIFGNIVSLGHKFEVKDLNNKTQIVISKNPSLFWQKYRIINNDCNEIMTINQGRSLFKPNIKIKDKENNKYFIKGDVLYTNFKMIDYENRDIFTVTKKYLKLGDTYEINIHKEELVMECIAILIAIDNCYFK